MYFKRSITFRLKSSKATSTKILIRASWCGNRVEFYTPHTIDPKQWDSHRQRAKGEKNNEGVSVSVINSDLNTLYTYIDDIFHQFEFVDKRPPTAEELKSLYNDAIGKETAKDIGDRVFLTLRAAYQEFLKFKRGKIEHGTFKHYITLGNHLDKHFSASFELEQVNRKALQGFQDYLLNEAKLRNVTTERVVNFFRTFLRWASEQNLYSGDAHIKFVPKLKGTKAKEIIILTKEELQILADYRFTDKQKNLEIARDLLLFGCYTGLRYSDIKALTKANIVDDKIQLITIKDTDTLSIELNSVSRAIIEKYKDFDTKRLLPAYSNQKQNQYLKIVGRLAGLNAPTSTTYYDADGRNTEVKPKWQMLTTHIARRTFISNALSLGIPVSMVMGWSGHSDYKAMEPYIKMIDKQKRQAMDKLDDIIK